MITNKKMLLSFGAILAVGAPIATVIACGGGSEAAKEDTAEQKALKTAVGEKLNALESSKTLAELSPMKDQPKAAADLGIAAPTIDNVVFSDWKITSLEKDLPSGTVKVTETKGEVKTEVEMTFKITKVTDSV